MNFTRNSQTLSKYQANATELSDELYGQKLKYPHHAFNMLYCALNLNVRIAFGGTYTWNALGEKSVSFDLWRMGIVKNMYLYLNAGSRVTPSHDDNQKRQTKGENLWIAAYTLPR